ncbi:unnamed protein product [Peronospora belbahrii]|uniref:Uncharacterized protein n=1 Tax=Peronospora belbahrii TaxID=622444 RepID=A0AAU9LFD6_9STRA|nr:unnamed protein product [Peronospora belbahrii]CAH0519185.1 unnamed protein product [Peronospora belbahrii]
MLRITRHVYHTGSRHTLQRRLNYGTSAQNSVGQENSSFITLLGLAGVITSVTYVYYDPDVLPSSVKKWLLIQEPEGRGMSVEEYEQWRAKQSGFPTVVTSKKEEEKAKHVHLKEMNVEPPNMNGDTPIPHGDESPEEMKASLEKLLAEARENEAAFIADIKSNRVPVSAEDRQMLQAFKDEKLRLKKQLKFLKSNK